MTNCLAITKWCVICFGTAASDVKVKYENASYNFRGPGLGVLGLCWSVFGTKPKSLFLSSDTISNQPPHNVCLTTISSGVDSILTVHPHD